MLRGARNRMARKPSALARELLRNFPKGKRARQERRRNGRSGRRKAEPRRRPRLPDRRPARRRRASCDRPSWPTLGTASRTRRTTLPRRPRAKTQSAASQAGHRRSPPSRLGRCTSPASSVTRSPSAVNTTRFPSLVDARGASPARARRRRAVHAMSPSVERVALAVGAASSAARGSVPTAASPRRPSRSSSAVEHLLAARPRRRSRCAARWRFRAARAPAPPRSCPRSGRCRPPPSRSCGRASIRMPATLRPLDQTSFGHLISAVDRRPRLAGLADGERRGQRQQVAGACRSVAATTDSVSARARRRRPRAALAAAAGGLLLREHHRAAGAPPAPARARGRWSSRYVEVDERPAERPVPAAAHRPQRPHGAAASSAATRRRRRPAPRRRCRVDRDRDRPGGVLDRAAPRRPDVGERARVQRLAACAARDSTSSAFAGLEARRSHVLAR